MAPLLVLGAVGGAVLLALQASAHVDADPLALQKGTTATVAFKVEHGCDASPTTKLELKFPDAFTGITPVDLAGWQAVAVGNVVTFSGGTLDAKTPANFAVQVTAPTAAGTQFVPIVQTCETGALRWIEIPEDGKAEPALPAAAIKVTEGVPTADDLTATDDAAPVESSSRAGLVVGLASAAVVIAGGVVLFLRKRGSAPTQP